MLDRSVANSMSGSLHVGEGQAIETASTFRHWCADQRHDAIMARAAGRRVQPPRCLDLLDFVFKRAMRSPIRRRSASICVSPDRP